MRYRSLILAYSLGFFLHLPLIVIGQDVQTYTGSLKIGTYKGDANYNYSLRENDTILIGNFEFEKANPKALIGKGDVSFSIKGQFENDYPEGYWKFEFNEFQSSRKSKVEDNKYVVNVNGKQRIAFGNLKLGNPDGEWTIKEQEIKNSKVQKVNFNSIIEFNQGIPQRSFTIQDDYQELVGRFLRNGLAHDRWTLFSDSELEEIESWKFNDGVLQSIHLQSRQTTKRIEVDVKDIDSIEVIPLNDKFFEILKLKLPSDKTKRILESGIAQLLSRNNKHYQSIDTVLSQLGTSSFTPQFKVSVPFYPIQTDEKRLIDSISSYVKKSSKISDYLLTDTQLSIRKLSDKDVRALEDTVEEIFEYILIPLQEISGYADNGLLRYIDRTKLLPRFWNGGISELQSFEKYDIKLKDKIDKKSEALVVLNTLASQSFLRLEGIKNILEKKIDKQEKQQEAIALEKEMIKQHNYLAELSESALTDSIPKVYYSAIEKLKNDAQEKLSAYSTINDVNEKLSFGKELVDCFKKFNGVGKGILKLPVQQDKIREKYQDAVWNPFIATVMDEMVKKRIVSAYENVLIPYFLQNIEEGLSCEDASKWVVLVDSVYDRMLTLREEDTKKMERKLKKEEDPLIILQRFQIEPQSNEY